MRLDSGIGPVFSGGDALQTIVPVITSSRMAVSSCTLLELTPGSVISGQSGFVMASCPTVGSAIVFRGTTMETPVFLATGWVQISLLQMGNACSFKFNDPVDGHLIGMNLTSTNPVPFSSDYSNTTLYAGGGMGYNYCLYYSNPPIGGIGSFTISWSP